MAEGLFRRLLGDRIELTIQRGSHLGSVRVGKGTGLGLSVVHGIVPPSPRPPRERFRP